MNTLVKLLKSKFFWINILAVIGVTVVIIVAALIWTRFYTHHGESVEVPDLTHMYIEEVEIELNKLDLKYDIIDSVYLRSFQPGEVAEQTPAPGTFVKKNRKIYLTVNCRQRQKVTIPDVIGESFRKAQSNLRTLGFSVDSVSYRPYEFDGELLDLVCNGRSVHAGEKLPDGTMLILVVGKSDTEHTVFVPNLVGLSFDEALEIIRDNELSLGNVSYDVRPVSETERLQYHVFFQSPAAGQQVYRGKLIELKLSRTKGTESEEFF